MSYDLSNTHISDNYQRLLQITSGNTLVDGLGDTIAEISANTLSASTIYIEGVDLYDIFSTTGLTPVHHTENTDTNVTYVGFGATGATSIMKVISYSGNSYDTLWAEGNKIQNKNWDDRFIYSYSAIT